jgi:hypothetical protein
VSDATTAALDSTAVAATTPTRSARSTQIDGTDEAHRVERMVRVGGRVVLELRPVGLEIAETVRVTLPEDRLVCRLGTAAD